MRMEKETKKKKSKSQSPLDIDKDFVSSLFEQSIDGIMIIDSEGVVQLANPKAKALFSALVDPLEGYTMGIPVLGDAVEIQVHHTGEPRTIEMRTKEIEWSGQKAYLSFLRDITKRIQAQSDLRESEVKYRQLFENSINGYILSEVIYDESGSPMDGEVLDINPALERQFGLKKEDVLGKSAANLFPVFREQGVLRFFRDVAGTGEAKSFECHFESIHKDFIIAVYSPEIGKVATIFSDITDRKSAEEKLIKSERKYRTLFEMMTQGVIYLDQQGRIDSLNPAAERILGFDQESSIGKALDFESFRIHKLDLTPFPTYRLPHKIALRTGRSVIDSVLCLGHPERQECLWINISAIPQFHEGEEEPYQVVVTFLDITDRIRVQRAFQERVKELRCISNVSSFIQEDPTLEELCQLTVQQLVPALQYPQIAVAVVDLAGRRYESGGYSDDLDNYLHAPIKSHDDEFGHVTVYYREAKAFILPEEQNLVDSIAERLGSYCERRHTHEQLEKSEERFRKAILDAPIPIMIYTEEGEILVVNNAWVNRSGYDHEEIPTLFDWLQKAHPNRYKEIIKIMTEGSQSDYMISEEEYPIHTKDGEDRIWLITTAPLETLPDGKRTAISMARDITERKTAEIERERYYNRITALREVDQVVGSTLDLSSVLDRITMEMQKLIAFDSMTVMLINQNEMEIIACQGFEKPEDIVGLVFPSKPGYPNYEVVQQKAPVCYENVSEVYPLFKQPTDEDDRNIIKTWLGVPLINQDEVIGMFTVDRSEENLFSEDEVAIVMEFAKRAAIAITNAQLYEQTRAQVEKLEILRNIDAVITGNMNLDESLLEILCQIRKGLSVDAVSIILYDEETDQLVSEQGVGFKTEIRSEITMELGKGFAGDVAKNRKELFIPEIQYKGESDKYPIDLIAEGIRSYYGMPLIVKDKLEGVLQMFNRTPLDPDEDWVGFADALAGQAAVAVNNISLITNLEEANRSLIEAYDATIEGWAHALELRDKETEGHSRRVVDLTLKIAKQFGFHEEELHHIRQGVLLHDIGKMGIPDEILRKPGPLTETEWDMMRRHPVFAYDMLKSIDYLEPALRIPHYHHERWDGSGYPEGLKGEEIPLEARIFAVVDIWDALQSDRYYRDAWSREKALRYIKDQAGILLDPQVVSIFLDIVEGDRIKAAA